MARDDGFHVVPADFDRASWSELPFGRWRAWVDVHANLASRAAHSREVGGRGVRLRKGEFLASGAYLASRWGWSSGKVRAFVEELLRDGDLVRVRRTPVGTVYSVGGRGDGPKEPKNKAAPRAGKPPGPGNVAVREAWEEKVIAAARATLPPIPSDLDVPEFAAAWRARLVERAEKGKKGELSYSQVAAQFAKLVRLSKKKGIAAAVQCVERATENGYTGTVYKEDFEDERGRRKSPGQQRLFQPEEEGGSLDDREEVI